MNDTTTADRTITDRTIRLDIHLNSLVLLRRLGRAEDHGEALDVVAAPGLGLFSGSNGFDKSLH